jgi:Type VI secretion system effector, Hcp
MKKTILVVGIACAAVMALGQSNARQDNPAQATGAGTPRDVASGQASGKRMHKPLTITKSMDKSSPGLTVRESPSKSPLGKTSVDSDSQANAKNSMSGAQSNPMYKDNGTAGENPLFEGKDRTATKTRSNIQNNRMATGDVNGDGMTDRAIVKSKSNITNNRVDAANADAHAMTDAPSAAPAQMKGDFSRGHQPDRKASTKSNTSRDAQSGLATGKRQHN